MNHFSAGILTVLTGERVCRRVVCALIRFGVFSLELDNTVFYIVYSIIPGLLIGCIPAAVRRRGAAELQEARLHIQ